MKKFKLLTITTILAIQSSLVFADYSQDQFKINEAKAKVGSVKDQYILGHKYQVGDGTQKDYSKAFEWFEKAAKAGHKEAQNELGILYANGRGVRQDFTKAEEWYLKSANQNYTLAQRNLADLYLDGRGSVPSNSQKAVKYLKLAADKGDADCQYNLGVVYVEGLCTRQIS